MTIQIKHAKTNAITDWTQPELDAIIAGGAPPLPPSGTTLSQVVLPSDWNADLTTSMATGKLVGRSTAGTGSFEEITVGSGLTLSGGTLSGAGGDVVGPASSTDNALARYDGTTGKLVQNSNALLNDDGQLTLTSTGFSARKVYQTFKNASGYTDATITEGNISGYGGVFQLNDGTGGAGYCRVEYNGGYPQLVTNQTSFSFLGSGFQTRYSNAYIDFSVSGYTPLYLGASSVGIFTSTPVSTFHVKNPSAGTIPFIVEMAASQTANAFQIRDSSGTPIVYFASQGDQTIANTYPWYGLKPTGWGTLFYFQAGVNLAGSSTGDYTLFLNPTGKGFSWNQGSTSKFVIDATTGYLGINNTSPSYQLDVTGAAGSIAARVVASPPASANNSSYSAFIVSATSKSAGDQLWTLYNASFVPDNACRLTHYAAHFSPSNTVGITEFKGYSTYFAGYNNTSYGDIHGYHVVAPASVNPPSTLANFYGFYCGDLNASNVTYTNAPYSFYAVSGRAFLGDAFVINPSSTSKIPLTLKLAASHTAKAFTIQNSSSADLAYFDASANLFIGNSTSASTSAPTTLNMGGTYADTVTSAKAKWKLYYDGTDIQTYGIGISAGQMNFFKYTGGSYKWYFSDVEKMGLTSDGLITASRVSLTSSFSAGNPIFKITATNDAGTSPYIMEVVSSSGGTMFGLSENSGNNKGIIYGVESIQGMSTIALSGSSVNSGAAINVASSNLTMGWYGAGTYSFIDSYSSVLAINSWQNTDVVISGTTAGAKLQVNTVSASKKGVLIKMAATPTANPFEIQDSSSVARFYVASDFTWKQVTTSGNLNNIIDSPTGLEGGFIFKTNGTDKWQLYNAAGVNFGIYNYGLAAAALTVQGSTNDITLGGALTVNGALTLSGSPAFACGTITSTNAANNNMILQSGATSEAGILFKASSTTKWQLYANNNDSSFRFYSFDLSKELMQCSSGGTWTFVSGSASAKAMIVKLSASQTANAFEIQDSSSAALAYFDSVGALQTPEIYFGAGTLTSISRATGQMMGFNTSGIPTVGVGMSEVRVVSGGIIGFSSHASNVISATADTAIARNAAGVIEINNGSAGTYRDLKLRNIETVAGNFTTDTTTGTKIGTGTTQKLGFWNATPVVQSTGWSATNVTTDKSFDANATTIDELADVLGTLIDTLKLYGILGA